MRIVSSSFRHSSYIFVPGMSHVTFSCAHILVIIKKKKHAHIVNRDFFSCKI